MLPQTLDPKEEKKAEVAARKREEKEKDKILIEALKKERPVTES